MVDEHSSYLARSIYFCENLTDNGGGRTIADRFSGKNVGASPVPAGPALNGGDDIGRYP
jgi:hypothetical protein